MQPRRDFWPDAEMVFQVMKRGCASGLSLGRRETDEDLDDAVVGVDVVVGFVVEEEDEDEETSGVWLRSREMAPGFAVDLSSCSVPVISASSLSSS